MANNFPLDMSSSGTIQSESRLEPIGRRTMSRDKTRLVLVPLRILAMREPIRHYSHTQHNHHLHNRLNCIPTDCYKHPVPCLRKSDQSHSHPPHTHRRIRYFHTRYTKQPTQA